MYHLIYDPGDADEAYMIASEDGTYLTGWCEDIPTLLSTLDHNIADPANDTPFFEWQSTWETFFIVASFPEIPTLEQIQTQHPELLI